MEQLFGYQCWSNVRMVSQIQELCRSDNINSSLVNIRRVLLHEKEDEKMIKIFDALKTRTFRKVQMFRSPKPTENLLEFSLNLPSFLQMGIFIFVRDFKIQYYMWGSVVIFSHTFPHTAQYHIFKSLLFQSEKFEKSKDFFFPN